MKVDAIRLDLRPRGMFEAADLGVRLVSAHLRSVWTSCAPVYAFVLLVAATVLPFGIGWIVLTVIWLKPWLDRSILFVLARAVFGEETRFADVWAARRHLAGSSCSRLSAFRTRCCWRPTSSSRSTVASRPSASNSIRAAAARHGRSRPAPPAASSTNPHLASARRW